MWDGTEFPQPEPQSSYELPVQLVLVDPDDTPDHQVCFRREWLPYVLGSLQQLLQDTTWKTTDESALNLVQARSQQLISQFIQGCVPELPDEGCIDYPPYSPIISYAPQDPFRQPDVIPDGYIAPAFYVVQNDLIELLFEGVQVGDVLSGYLSLPVLTPALGQGLARFRVNLIGSGTVELHLINIPNGGVALVTHDDNPLTAIVIELNKDYVQLPPETLGVVIHERTFETGGLHHIDVTFLPRFNDEAIFIGYGGGIRKVVLCGFDEMADLQMDVRQNPTTPCILEKSINGTDWDAFADISECAGTDGTDGREIELRNSGTYIQWRYVGDTAWTDLASIASITGPAGSNGSDGSDGSNGTNGREIELRNSGTYIQWRYVGDTAWTDLVSIASITGPTGATGAAGPKIVGTIIPYATAAVPSGCLACDGATYLRTDYPALYAALHANFKIDADHFVVPDLRGRTIIGIGTGASLTARAMKDSLGAETHTLTAAQIPAHTHPVQTANAGSSGSNISRIVANQGVTTTLTTNANTGGDGAHNNMQPSLALGYCIVATG